MARLPGTAQSLDLGGQDVVAADGNSVQLRYLTGQESGNVFLHRLFFRLLIFFLLDSV